MVTVADIVTYIANTMVGICFGVMMLANWHLVNVLSGKAKKGDWRYDLVWRMYSPLIYLLPMGWFLVMVGIEILGYFALAYFASNPFNMLLISILVYHQFKLFNERQALKKIYVEELNRELLHFVRTPK